jgi:hypothetical protein
VCSTFVGTQDDCTEIVCASLHPKLKKNFLQEKAVEATKQEKERKEEKT